MKRRNFLRNTSLAGMGLASLSAACSSSAAERKESDPKEPFQGNPGFILKGLSVDELQAKMESGEYTSRDITGEYIKRIRDVDSGGAGLNSIIELNPDAEEIAGRLDEERKSGKVRGPLHGIPVIIKDNINSGDRMMTTAGSLALEGHSAKEDAFIIRNLREAGAVLLGKANLSEWANFRSTRSSSGWSSRGGQTLCPYALDRDPSGSSSGSAVAVAADLCAVAIGTETDGSVVSPSSVNGIVGMKPTVGLLSRTGIIPISATQDTAGPMGRSVKDVAILLGALTGSDTDDPVTLKSRGKAQKDYRPYLDAGALKGKKIGIEKNYLRGNERVVELYKKAIGILHGIGASTVEVDLLDQLKGLGNDEFNVLLYEFKDGLNRYFAKEKTKTASLEELIRFNAEHPDKAMPFFTQEILKMSQEKGDLQSEEYLKALGRSTGSSKTISEVMGNNGLDAISSVTNGPAWFIDHVNGDYDTGFSFSTPAAISGFPHITVPMGTVFGLPVGFSFMGLPWTEPELLGMAYAFEKASPPRPVPEFRKTAGV